MTIKLPTRIGALLALVAATTATLLALFGAGSAGAASANVQSAASQNWAGYVASGKNFSSVSGSWTEPTVTASSSSDPSYSATWVGLGGSGGTSSSLEQIGTGADYVNGQPDYYAWYELLPAAQVRLNLAIHPGDAISARVAVSGNSVTLALNDTTTGQSVNRTLQMSNPDTTSAEWIVEAPAAQSFAGDQILPLADFSKVTFTSATATADGHTGGISDPNWTATQVQLNSPGGSGSSGGPGFVVGDGQAAYAQSSAGATTSALSTNGFSVSWQDTSSNQSTGAADPSQYTGPGSPYPYGYGGYGYGGYGE